MSSSLVSTNTTKKDVCDILILFPTVLCQIIFDYNINPTFDMRRKNVESFWTHNSNSNS